MKIIIEFPDSMDAQLALDRVASVIRGGRISQARGVAHFCWATSWLDGTAVYVNRKRWQKSADSFVVREMKVESP